MREIRIAGSASPKLGVAYYGAMTNRSIDTVIVGGGHAGLIMSRLLSEAGREHLVGLAGTPGSWPPRSS